MEILVLEFVTEFYVFLMCQIAKTCVIYTSIIIIIIIGKAKRNSN